jgi:hypothetical protein
VTIIQNFCLSHDPLVHGTVSPSAQALPPSPKVVFLPWHGRKYSGSAYINPDLQPENQKVVAFKLYTQLASTEKNLPPHKPSTLEHATDPLPEVQVEQTVLGNNSQEKSGAQTFLNRLKQMVKGEQAKNASLSSDVLATSCEMNHIKALHPTDILDFLFAGDLSLNLSTP